MREPQTRNVNISEPQTCSVIVSEPACLSNGVLILVLRRTLVMVYASYGVCFAIVTVRLGVQSVL